jgi:hypothetical protein
MYPYLVPKLHVRHPSHNCANRNDTFGVEEYPWLRLAENDSFEVRHDIGRDLIQSNHFVNPANTFDLRKLPGIATQYLSFTAINSNALWLFEEEE